jgi:hypothetical protein
MSQTITPAPESDADYELAVPRPGAMIESMRSVGYTLPTAIADLIDNSIAASARTVWIDFRWSGRDSTVSIVDDGCGMTEETLTAAMRPGTQSPLEERPPRDLGRFGLGLKTASFSHARCLTVASRAAGKTLAIRRWDLDYVSSVNEWRLLKSAVPAAESALDRLEELSSGTAVIWSSADRLVDERSASDTDAHEHFNHQIAGVVRHLGMTFHRFLAGEADGYSRALRIFVNGTAPENAVRPWDPFLRRNAATQPSPCEKVGVGASGIDVQTFIVPHKDRLGEAENLDGGGPNGWTAQQGFYVYRNDRILVAGDWLGLGRNRAWQKEEHCRLARIAVDIRNTHDFAWSLDVKKSSARPPPQLRERLTGIGEVARKRSTSIFFHRGQMGPRPVGGATPPMQRPWHSSHRAGGTAYSINRDHPMVDGVLRRLGPLRDEVEAMMRMLEETVPVERIWLDGAENPGGYLAPYDGIDPETIYRDLRRTFDLLLASGYTRQTALSYLERIDPFNRHIELITRLREE